MGVWFVFKEGVDMFLKDQQVKGSGELAQK